MEGVQADMEVLLEASKAVTAVVVREAVVREVAVACAGV